MVLRADQLPRARLDRAVLPARLSTLARGTLRGPPLAAARALLGAHLVRDDPTGRRVGRIVEVEAYAGPEDSASHARFGSTARNAVMFGSAGHAYVYLVYGMYDCLNVVTGPDGSAAAVLIRAIEPLEGLGLMRADRARITLGRRKTARVAQARPAPDHRLASGPGLVGAAFGLDRSWTGTDLCDPGSPLRLEAGRPVVDDADVVATPRIGIGYAGEPWASEALRLLVAGSASVSGPRGPRAQRSAAPR